jgi:hypothetical protein
MMKRQFVDRPEDISERDILAAYRTGAVFVTTEDRLRRMNTNALDDAETTDDLLALCKQRGWNDVRFYPSLPDKAAWGVSFPETEIVLASSPVEALRAAMKERDARLMSRKNRVV